MQSRRPPQPSPSRRPGAARRGPQLIALAAALVVTGEGPGQPPAAKDRTDSDRASLPAGVVARLGSNRFRFEGGSGDRVVFSPDGKLLACGDSRGVSVFEVTTGRRVHLFPTAERESARPLRFLDDGKRLAVAIAKNGPPRLTLFSLADGKPATVVELPDRRPTWVIDVTPDGSRALVVDHLKRVYLWDVKAGRELWSCEHPAGSAVLPLTADGKWFALTGFPTCQLRDAATGKLAARFPDPGRPFYALRNAPLSPDGRLAIPSQKGDAVAVLTALAPAGTRKLPARGQVEQFAFSGDSRFLAGVGSSTATQVWDLRAADDAGPVAVLPAAGGAGFSPDGKILALADIGFVALYSVGDWKPLPQSADPTTPVFRLRVPDDGKRVFGLTRDGWMAWPVTGGPPTRFRDDGLAGLRFRGYWGSGACADVSADGRVAVDLVRPPPKDRSDRRLVLSAVDAISGKPHTLPLDFAPGQTLNLSRDGRFVSVSGQGRVTLVWDTRTGEVVFAQERANDEWVMALQVTPDGRSLARSVVAVRPGIDADGPSYTQVVVYDHVAGTSWRMNPMPWILYSGVQFSRDGTRLFGRGRYNAEYLKDTVSVWDLRTGRRLVAWTGKYALDAHDLSADNRSLLVGDGDGRLTLVEVATGAERAHFDHRSTILSVAFLPDGSRAVASSPEAPVYVWDLIGKPGAWDTTKADSVWADLASPDAKTAYAAIRRLRANPGEAVPFLKAHIKPPTAPPDERVAQWLKDLDSPRFAAREQAQKELAAAADLIHPRLEAAKKGASFEAGRRIDEILKAANGWTPEQLRQLRACEVLEGVRTPDAVQVLKAWAAGPAGARLTVEAEASVGRLAP